jgi:heptaprenyl diphosphate synthase
MVSLELFAPRYVLLLVLLKVLGQALLNGTLASYVFIFSAAGSFASGFAMIGMYHLGRRHVSLIGIGVFGAIASNVVQIFFSVTFIFGQSAWVIAPLFIGLGVASGFFVGVFAYEFQRRSRWLQRIRDFYGG